MEGGLAFFFFRPVPEDLFGTYCWPECRNGFKLNHAVAFDERLLSFGQAFCPPYSRWWLRAMGGLGEIKTE